MQAIILFCAYSINYSNRVLIVLFTAQWMRCKKVFWYLLKASIWYWNIDFICKDRAWSTGPNWITIYLDKMAEQICNYHNIFNSVGRSYNANAALTFNWKAFTMLKTCANYSETVELWCWSEPFIAAVLIDFNMIYEIKVKIGNP